MKISTGHMRICVLSNYAETVSARRPVNRHVFEQTINDSACSFRTHDTHTNTSSSASYVIIVVIITHGAS